jgi:cobalt-zinc-cadmium efflux system protein
MTDAASKAGHVHDHSHHAPGHHGAGHAPASFGRAFAIGIALNAAYVIAEAAWGVKANSLALLSDAGHNLGDVLALGLAWMASLMGRRAPSARYTYGLRGSSILAALTNAVVLLVVTGGIAWAAILRLEHPESSAGATVMIVAAIGVGVNGITAWMFASGRGRDVNVRAAFAHMASDALVAAGVVAAGAAIYFTHWQWLDPIVSLMIGAVIVVGTWSLLRESLDLALQAVPIGVDRTAVHDYLAELPGVAEVHDLHIWGMSTTETALTAHLVRPGAAMEDALLHQICAELKARFRIDHATLQVEEGALDHPCHLADARVV